MRRTRGLGTVISTALTILATRVGHLLHASDRAAFLLLGAGRRPASGRR